MACGASKTGGAASARSGAIGLLLALSCALAEAGPVTTQGTWYGSNGWDGTLRGRDAAGNAVNLLNAAADAPNPDLKYVYDTRLDLTWLADWGVEGPLSWNAANNWVTNLLDFGGGWALPRVLDTAVSGCDYATANTDCGYNVYGSEFGRRVSPLAHMFYDTLGNLGLYDTAGNWPQVGWSGLRNTGPFTRMIGDSYWSSTIYAASPDHAWRFSMWYGIQDGNWQPSTYRSVPVRLGDVSGGVAVGAIPEPGGPALLGLVFGALAVARRRRTR